MQHFLDANDLRRSIEQSDGVNLLHPEQAVFESMLGAWSQQQQGRGLVAGTIDDRLRRVRRFNEFAGAYPWEWQASDLDEYSGLLRAKGLP